MVLSAPPAALVGQCGELRVGEEPLFALARAGALYRLFTIEGVVGV